jgi:hypothetical protein
MRPLDLPGLKGHHPLGFLAACGALRCCSLNGREAMLAWRVTEEDGGWVAVLHAKDLDMEILLDALLTRASAEKDSAALRWSGRIDDRGKFRAVCSKSLSDDRSTQDRGVLALLPALASDLVLNAKTQRLQPTALDFTSASQPFLKSIRDLSGDLSKKVKSSRSRPSPADSLRETFCGPWQYRDKTHSLGWDPQTQRLHALRNRLPEKDKQKRSVRGAVFLASLALPMYPCFAVNGRLRTTGFHRFQGQDWFAWPIWQEPISLDSVRTLLGHSLSSNLSQRGVAVVYRSRVVHTGGSKSNYRVFSSAEEFPWADM